MFTTTKKLEVAVDRASRLGRLDGFDEGVRTAIATVTGVIEGEILLLDDRRRASSTRWAKRKIEGGLEALLDIRSDLAGTDRP